MDVGVEKPEFAIITTVVALHLQLVPKEDPASLARPG